MILAATDPYRTVSWACAVISLQWLLAHSLTGHRPCRQNTVARVPKSPKTCFSVVKNMFKMHVVVNDFDMTPPSFDRYQNEERGGISNHAGCHDRAVLSLGKLRLASTF